MAQGLFGAATSVTSTGESDPSTPSTTDGSQEREDKAAVPPEEVTEWSRKFQGKRVTAPNQNIFLGTGAVGAEELYQKIIAGKTDWKTPVVVGTNKFESAKALFESENFWTDENPGYERRHVPITKRILETASVDNPKEWLVSQGAPDFQQLRSDQLSFLVFVNNANHFTPISAERFLELRNATNAIEQGDPRRIRGKTDDDGAAAPEIILGLGNRVGLFNKALFSRDKLTAKPVAIFDTREFLAHLDGKEPGEPYSESVEHAFSALKDKSYSERVEDAFSALLIHALKNPKPIESSGQVGDILASAKMYFGMVPKASGAAPNASEKEFADAVMKTAAAELTPQRYSHFLWHGIGGIGQTDWKELTNSSFSKFRYKEDVLKLAVANLMAKAT